MIGAQINRRTLTHKLGEGSMGAIYLAQHPVLGSRSVVKVLHPRWATDVSMVERFFAEARAASAIQHPSIVKVSDAAQLPDGTCFIEMEFLDGGTLDSFLKSQGGPISMHLAVQILATTTDGLEAAHAHEIVHCDLKPENIFLVRKDANAHHAMILDFGVARMSEQLSGLRTTPGLVAGTPAYMAPEQIFDRRTVDRRSDVYALGVIAYQMVTGGWLPFQDPKAPTAFFDLGIAAIFDLQKNALPIDPRKRGAAISERFAGAILAALHFDPSRRPQTARAFLLMLAEATAGDAYQMSGIEIVDRYASHLLDTNNLAETLRGRRPTARASRSKRYQVGELLGTGGMAEVYHGVVSGPRGVSRRVAIKRIRSAYSSDPNFVEMFVKEAKIAAQLTHQNIVSLLDFEHDEEGRLFLALEFVNGLDLRRLMEGGPIPHPVVIFVLMEMLAGLGYAHNLPSGGPMLGIVHRDLSPHNVLVSWDGGVKVSDFGLAKPRAATEVSASSHIKGKIAYLSPEQANQESLDGRSDLFALGIIAWEMLTGESLFSSDGFWPTFFRVLHWEIPKPSRYRPVPAVLEAIVMKLLERDAMARYANAELAREALAACEDAPKNGRAELVRHLVEQFPPISRRLLAPLPEPPPDVMTAASAPPRQPSPELATSVPTPAISSPEPITVVPWIPPPAYVPQEAQPPGGVAARHPSSVSIAASEAIPSTVTSRPSRGLPLTIAASAAIVAIVVTSVALSVRARQRSDERSVTLPERVQPTRAPRAADSRPIPSSIDAMTTTSVTLDAGLPAMTLEDAGIQSSVHLHPDVTKPPTAGATLSGPRTLDVRTSSAPVPGHGTPTKPQPRRNTNDGDEVGGD